MFAHRVSKLADGKTRPISLVHVVYQLISRKSALICYPSPLPLRPWIKYLHSPPICTAGFVHKMLFSLRYKLFTELISNHVLTNQVDLTTVRVVLGANLSFHPPSSPLTTTSLISPTLPNPSLWFKSSDPWSTNRSLYSKIIALL